MSEDYFVEIFLDKRANKGNKCQIFDIKCSDNRMSGVRVENTICFVTF
jgi:hypothetical protein